MLSNKETFNIDERLRSLAELYVNADSLNFPPLENLQQRGHCTLKFLGKRELKQTSRKTGKKS